MNTNEIKSIVESTLAEYAADLNKEIIDSQLKEGCVRDLEGASVFEDLAQIEDQSLSALGNEVGWKMNGRTAALSIAAHRVWEVMLGEDGETEYSAAVEAVEAATK